MSIKSCTYVTKISKQERQYIQKVKRFNKILQKYKGGIDNTGGFVLN